MNNPLNPLNWIQSAQDWFSRTEKSSGFRAYLIFLLIHAGLAVTLLSCFSKSELTTEFAVKSLWISFVGFVLLFIFKSIQDPGFCRSEKHIETVRRLELQEQKGDKGPSPIDVNASEAIGNPDVRQLSGGSERTGV